MPGTNSPESFGIVPGDPDYPASQVLFTEGSKDEVPPSRAAESYDDSVGTAWKMRAEGRDAEATDYLQEGGIIPDGETDGR